jgi:hypothetical protein
VLLLCVAPKPLPVIVIVAIEPSLAKGPWFEERPERVGGCSTVNGMLLLKMFPTWTVTLPLVAFDGTWTVRLVLLEDEMLAAVPLKRTCVVNP